MPIYMDVHIVPGVKARDVAEAHRKDLLIEREHDCKCITYWIDEERENIFCLIEAPNKDAVSEMHGRSHGLIPNKVIEVSSSLIGSFLGRIYDPLDAKVTEDGLKVFADPSFRVILMIKVPDAALLEFKHGADQTQESLQQFYDTTRNIIQRFRGREVEGSRGGFVTSFSSAADAVLSALEIQKQNSQAASPIGDLRMALHAGEPVEKSEELFGDTLQLAGYMCALNGKQRITISSAVNSLITKDIFKERKDKIRSIAPSDEDLLKNLFETLENHWRNPDFNVSEFCDAMAMSKSQLYRKTISLCGASPVILLKNFRLEKAKELMNKKRYNISEITFDTGFTSPSYFTKCFRKCYGLPPMTYVDLLH